MYLATTHSYKNTSYSIRISEYDAQCGHWLPKDIFNLGSNPQDHFADDQKGFISFSETLHQAISSHTSGDPDPILEELLFDFFSHETKSFLERYPSRKDYTVTPLSHDEVEQIPLQLNTLDLRRLYFLRYGAVDQRHLHKVHKKLCRPLLNCSRDEKEHYFMEQEKVIPQEERKSYVYAIFDLQRHFSQSFAPFMPEGLPEIEIEEYFVEELCRLARNIHFLQEQPLLNSLLPHLRRYVIMFFDHSFAPGSYTNDFIRNFRRTHTDFKWPETKVKVSDEEIIDLFGTSRKNLEAMSKHELTRLYRQKAKELHPDKGGDHELFIKLTEAYSIIKKAK